MLNSDNFHFCLCCINLHVTLKEGRPIHPYVTSTYYVIPVYIYILYIYYLADVRYSNHGYYVFIINTISNCQSYITALLANVLPCAHLMKLPCMILARWDRGGGGKMSTGQMIRPVFFWKFQTIFHSSVHCAIDTQCIYSVSGNLLKQLYKQLLFLIYSIVYTV